MIAAQASGGHAGHCRSAFFGMRSGPVRARLRDGGGLCDRVLAVGLAPMILILISFTAPLFLVPDRSLVPAHLHILERTCPLGLVPTE